MNIPIKKIKPRKLGHIVLAVRDIHRSVDFYTKILGLQVSDWISDQMVFLRSGTDHHDLALAQIPQDSLDINDLPRYSRPGLEHFSYLVDSLADIEDDPDGNNVELYCEMEQIPLDHPRDPQVWVRNIQSFDQWNFKKFVVPPPPSMVKEKS